MFDADRFVPLNFNSFQSSFFHCSLLKGAAPQHDHVSEEIR